MMARFLPTAAWSGCNRHALFLAKPSTHIMSCHISLHHHVSQEEAVAIEQEAAVPHTPPPAKDPHAPSAAEKPYTPAQAPFAHSKEAAKVAHSATASHPTTAVQGQVKSLTIFPEKAAETSNDHDPSQTGLLGCWTEVWTTIWLLMMLLSSDICQQMKWMTAADAAAAAAADDDAHHHQPLCLASTL